MSVGQTGDKQSPIERDVNYLTAKHGMTPEQALSYLNSAKTQTREQFITNVIKERGLGASNEDIVRAGELYDAMQALSPHKTPDGAASNSSAPRKIDGRIANKIGIP